MKSVSEAGAAASSDRDREEAGKRIARRILTTCWSSLLSQLLTTVAPYLLKPAGMAGKSALYGFLGGNASRKGGGGAGFGGKSQDARLVAGIDCLQVATTLCSNMELHNRCGQVLEPLTALICPDQTEALKGGGKRSREGAREHPPVAKINLVDLMVIEDILQDRLLVIPTFNNLPFVPIFSGKDNQKLKSL